MKLQPFYCSPVLNPENKFEPVSRREAAQLVRQWRRYGFATIRRIKGRETRGYRFDDWHSSTHAALVLKP